MGTSTQSGGTQTTRIEPPNYQLPYLQEGLTAARGLFNEGGNQQYGGSTVTPFASQTEQALTGIQNRATNGSPVTQAGQGYVADTLGGKYLDPNSNPYLDQTFQHAAQQTQAAGEAQYAGTGRNVQAGAPQRMDLLSGLATQIYGGAYDAERNRQQGVLPYVSPLAESDYRDLAALQGVGQTVENKAGQYQQDAASRFAAEQQRPEQALNDYLARISGNIGQTSVQQLPDQTRSRGTGALGGALGGAQLGSSFGPWGTLIGGVGGGLLGAYG